MPSINEDLTHVGSLTSPGLHAADVVKSDATVFPCPCRALYIGVSGDVVVTMGGTETPITFKAVPVGILPVRVTQVLAATTATDIVALW